MDPLDHSMFVVTAFGARGDDATLNTHAIQSAIDACAAQGGGTVLIPTGTFRTGALELRSFVTLHLAAGARLCGSADAADYPVIGSRWEGAEQQTHAPLIGGRGATRIAITGQGTIDGRGEPWWQRFTQKTLDWPRPRLIAFADCDHVLIDGVTLKNSPSWTINPVRCRNVTVQNITIANPLDSPNTDGINPDSCDTVHIANCTISVGDDCITIKSGTEHEHSAKRAPCQNVTITNCTMANGHGGVVIGSEMSGDVRNVVISNCVFVGTDRGIRLKSRRGRGGVVEDVRVSNIVMTDVLCPLTMNLYYGCGAWGDTAVSDKRPAPVSAATPRFRRIHISQISARGAKIAAAFLFGLAEMPLEDIALHDIDVSIAETPIAGYADMADDLELMQGAGMLLRNVRRLQLDRVTVRGQRGPAITIADAAHVEVFACGSPTPDADSAVIVLNNVDGAFVHGCQAFPDTPTFLRLEGAATREVAVSANYLARAALPIDAANDLPAAVAALDITNQEHGEPQ